MGDVWAYSDDDDVVGSWTNGESDAVVVGAYVYVVDDGDVDAM